MGCKQGGQHHRQHLVAGGVYQHEHQDVRDHRCVAAHSGHDIARPGQTRRLDDGQIRLEQPLDLFQRQNQIGGQGTTNTTAEEFLHLHSLLAEILAVDPYLADLVFDYRYPLRNSRQPPRHLQQQRCLTRTKKASDNQQFHFLENS